MNPVPMKDWSFYDEDPFGDGDDHHGHENSDSDFEDEDFGSKKKKGKAKGGKAKGVSLMVFVREFFHVCSGQSDYESKLKEVIQKKNHTLRMYEEMINVVTKLDPFFPPRSVFWQIRTKCEK